MFKEKDIIEFDGLNIIKNSLHSDERGEFKKLFSLNDISQNGWSGVVHQINISKNKYKGTLRGMHLQFDKYSEYKLVTCIKGSIFDVVVDLRQESKTFLDFFSIELNQNEYLSLLIPPGFAHGFQTLVDNCDVLYAHSMDYRKNHEGGCSATDSNLGIKWPLEISFQSSRDKNLPLIEELLNFKNDEKKSL